MVAGKTSAETILPSGSGAAAASVVVGLAHGNRAATPIAGGSGPFGIGAMLGV